MSGARAAPSDNPFSGGGRSQYGSGGTFGTGSSSRGLPPVPQSVRSTGGPSDREAVETEIIKYVMFCVYSPPLPLSCDEQRCRPSLITMIIRI